MSGCTLGEAGYAVERLTTSSPMKGKKVFRYKGGPSEILESIHYEGYEIKSLRHGNTGHVLYCSPSKEYEWEDCWGMDLQTAKNNVSKHNQSKNSKKV